MKKVINLLWYATLIAVLTELVLWILNPGTLWLKVLAVAMSTSGLAYVLMSAYYFKQKAHFWWQLFSFAADEIAELKKCNSTQKGNDYDVDKICIEAYGDLARLTTVVAHVGEYSFDALLLGDIVIVNGNVWHYTLLGTNPEHVVCVGKPLPVKELKPVQTDADTVHSMTDEEFEEFENTNGLDPADTVNLTPER